jgi:hypothetical protein
MDIDRISILISLDFFYGFLCFTTRLMPQKHKKNFCHFPPLIKSSLRFFILVESSHKAIEMKVMHVWSDGIVGVEISHFVFYDEAAVE